jgi:zona occludens toxin
MITFISGVPGAGKTAVLVDMLLDIVKDRPLFSCNVEGLLLDHIDLPDPFDWMSAVPDGSIVVIDEVQRFWKAGGSSTALLPSITALETHRHRGLDFYILSQGPNLIHANVRALVGRHIHLRNVGVLGRHWYEWPECNDQVRTAWKNAPIKKRFTLPKRAFKHYKSASLHVKPIFGVPRALIFVFIVLVVALYLGWRFYFSVSAKLAPAILPVPASSRSHSGSLIPASEDVRTASLFVDERVDFLPRVRGRPWTAPAYDHLRQVVSMPAISSAICVGKKCDCYDGHHRLDLDDDQCATWARDRPFNPYLPRDLSGNSSGDTRIPRPQINPLPSSSSNELLSMRSPLPLQ